jgi:protein-disulfide isomerase
MTAQDTKKSDWLRSLIAILLGILIGAVATAAFSGYFVRRYIDRNPEVVGDAIRELEARQTASIIDPHRRALETPYHGGWAGAARPQVVLVELFDYACSFCRASNPHVDRLIRENPGLRVVYREFPVLGPNSEQAAIASLAAARAGKFKQFHDALFAAGPPTPETIAAASRAVGLGEAELTEDVTREVRQNMSVARALGAQGTPTFVVGDRILHGAVGYEALRDAIAEARERRES